MSGATTLYAFPESAVAAGRLSAALGVPYRDISARSFPDGESLVRLDGAAGTAIVYRSLDDPNEKLVELMLAASILRDTGATRLILFAPYMCYMRQDIAFHTGEAVSQKVVGRFIDGLFDGVVTVDPHLHRTSQISEVFPAAQAIAVSAAPLFVAQLRADGISEDAVLVGPDAESRQWVEAVAEPLGLDVLVGEKIRRTDRRVEITVPKSAIVKGRPVVMVDDVVSTGNTLIQCAQKLREASAASIEVLAVHALWGPEEEAALRAAGISRLRSTDSVPHPSNTIHLATLLADALKEIQI